MERLDNWPGKSFTQPGCRLHERLVEVEAVNYLGTGCPSTAIMAFLD